MEIIANRNLQNSIKLLDSSKKLKELEKKYISTLTRRNMILNYRDLQKKLEKSIEKHMLIKKIRKETSNQDDKIIRKNLPKGPKLDPLPYKKKILENIRKSLNEPMTPKKSNFYTNRLSYSISPVSFNENSKKSPQKQNLTLFQLNLS